MNKFIPNVEVQPSNPVKLLEAIKKLNYDAITLMRQGDEARAASGQDPTTATRNGGGAGKSFYTKSCEILTTALQTLRTVLELQRSSNATEHDGGQGNTASLASAAASVPSEIQTSLVLTLNNLACVCRRTGQEDTALEWLQQTRIIEINLHGRPSLSTMLNMCTVLIAVNRADEAIPMAKACITAARASASSDSPEQLAIALHNCATAQQHSTQPHERRQATATMIEAYNEARRVLGDNHPTTNLIRGKCGLTSPSAERLTPRPPSNATTLNIVAPIDRSGTAKDQAQIALRALPTDHNALANAILGAQQHLNTMNRRWRQSSVCAPQLRTASAASANILREEPEEMSTGVDNEVAEGVSVPETHQKDIDDNFEQLTVSTHNTIPVTVNATVMSGKGATNTTSASMLYGQPRRDVSQCHAGVNVGVMTNLKSYKGTNETQKIRSEFATVADLTHRLDNASNNTAASFMRFMPISIRYDPPTPASFKDIREELQIEKKAIEILQQLRNKNAAFLKKAQSRPSVEVDSSGIPVDESVTQVVRLNAATSAMRFRGTVYRRSVKLEQEEKEEMALRAQQKRSDEQTRKEMERRQKLNKLNEARRSKAAVLIQRVFRQWWRRVGNGNVRRPLESNHALGVPKIFPTLVRCARKWLQKSAGRRMLSHLLKGRSPANYIVVVEKVSKIQCAWRNHHARVTAAWLHKGNDNFTKSRQEYEKRFYAALKIQSFYRQICARRTVDYKRATYYESYAVKIQKFVRTHMVHKRVTRAQKNHTEYLSAAATNIQRMWRRYQGRATAAMMRIKAKIIKMRTKEQQQRIDIRRVCHGYLVRKHIARDYWQYRKELPQRLALEDAAYQLALHQPPIETMLVPTEEELYCQAAEQRAYDLEQAMAKETEFHAKEIYLDRIVREYKEEAMFNIYAPNQTEVARFRAIESVQRDLEKNAFISTRAAVAIQRLFRRWIKKCHTLPSVDNRRVYQRFEAQKANYRIKSSKQKEEERKAYCRELIADLSAPIRTEKALLQSEIDELKQHVRTEINIQNMRSIPCRNNDAQMCSEMEAQIEDRWDNDVVKMRELTISGNDTGKRKKVVVKYTNTFITARQRLALGKVISNSGN